METFHDLIASHGSSFTQKHPWIQVGWPKQRQGWKLHLSSIPVLSGDLLRTVCPLLVQHGVAWKCLESRHQLAQINDGSLGQTQIGKFLTVYLDDAGASRQLLADLVSATRGFRGPRIPNDLRISDIVYARYGCFVPTYDRLGNRQCLIVVEGQECQEEEKVPPFCEAAFAGRYNPYGRDIRDRFRHQSPPIERGEDTFLVTDYVNAPPLATLPGCSIERAARMAEAIRCLHTLGIVHRDLSPKNLLLDDETITIIDWKLAVEPGSADQPCGLGTPGFMSPRQAEGAPPSFGDDIYAYGSLIVYLITGSAADRFADVPDLARTLRFMDPPVDERVVEVALRCLGLRGRENTPDSMDDVLCLLSEPGRNDAPGPVTTSDLARQIRGELPKMIAGIFECPSNEQGLWYSASLDDARQLELRKDLHHGNAGILLSLSHLPPELLDDPQRERLARVADWLASPDPRPQKPGLFFGASGRALALAACSRPADFRAAGWRDAASRLMVGPLDWPDITHGAAGHGIAALLCHQITQQPSFLTAADAAAEYLLASQSPDGSWALPAGVPGFEGKVLYGFGHGVAGIACFLLRYAHQRSHAGALAAFERAVEYLGTAGLRTGDTGDALSWTWGKDDPQMWNWWCHGAVGIALLFIQAYELTGRREYQRLAREALASFPTSRREANLGLCHGLAGYGQTLLCANAIDPCDWYLSRLEEVVATIWHSRHECGGVLYWKTNGPSARPTADLMTGTMGIVDFLYQYASGRHGFPGLSIPASYVWPPADTPPTIR